MTDRITDLPPGVLPRMPRNGPEPVILTVPGLGGSGPDHWQTLWEARDSRVVRVDLGDCERPVRNAWVNRLNLAIHRASADGSRPVVLAAHSLGCLAVAWWAHYEEPAWANPVVGAMLVAPPDVDGAARDARLRVFAPTPLGPLPFPSVVIASRDDPWSTLAHAERLASFWGSRFVDHGEAGHINAESGLGAWDRGRRELRRLARESAAAPSMQPPPPEPLSIFA